MGGIEIEQLIVIDNRLESYKEFYDHAKAKQLDALVTGTKLETPALALCTNWKAASNTMRLPWLTVSSTESWGRGFAKERGFAGRFTTALANQLPKRMGDNLSKGQKLTMIAAVHEVGEQVQRIEKDAATKAIDKQELWEAFIDASTPGTPEFQLAVWGSQRIGYSATYHAYENFIRECLAILENDPDYRTSNIKKLVADVLHYFGQPILDDCILDKQVNAARLIRNSLAHNGGMETTDLPTDHGIRVEGGILQIMAPDVRQLMHLLQDRAYRLAEKGVTLPQLR